jgi:hypothetical protein
VDRDELSTSIENPLLLVDGIVEGAAAGDIARLRGTQSASFQLTCRRSEYCLRGFEFLEEFQGACAPQTGDHSQSKPVKGFFLS